MKFFRLISNESMSLVDSESLSAEQLSDAIRNHLLDLNPKASEGLIDSRIQMALEEPRRCLVYKNKTGNYRAVILPRR